MIEPFFGSGPALWAGAPSPGSAWFQARAAAPGFGSPQVDPFGYGAFGVPGIVPALVGPEVAQGPTARTLVAAVAIRRGQPMGPTNEQELEEFIYDALDMLGANDVEVRYEGGRTTLTGSVAHKRLKRDVGEVAWAMPNVADVQNNVVIAGRRRSRPNIRDAEPQAPASRKQA